VGEQITEADWRLFTMLVRFAAVYVGHFKCNRIGDLPNLSGYHDRQGLVPLAESVMLIGHARRHEIEYLNGQLFLEPYPTELMLRNHV
jgi:putative glutathione S-transferase